jgi:hypothetical protein
MNKRNPNTFKVGSLFEGANYTAICSEQDGSIISHTYGDGVEIYRAPVKRVRYYQVMKSNGYQSIVHSDYVQKIGDANAMAERLNRRTDGYSYNVQPVYFGEEEFKQEQLF